MLQFIRADDAALQQLESRCRYTCLCFQQQLMPDGAVPTRARVGIERDQRSGRYCLLVNRNVNYSGSNAEVAEWLRSGRREFGNFASLICWIRDVLAGCYGVGANTRSESFLTPDVRPDPASLTDLDAIEDVDGEDSPAVYVSEVELAAGLCEQVRGQETAISTVARRVCRHLARKQPRRPATIFLIGSTGCGKTKTAELLPHILAKYSRDQSDFGYLRLDMSEYQEGHRISQLLGAPQGYIGFGEGSQLLDSLTANPRTLVLFDEIEKAHPLVFRTLMNAMDAGRLSSSARLGRTHVVDCRQSIFVFTSNLDCDEILAELHDRNCAADPDSVNDVIRKLLRRSGMPSELIGRISSFAVFQPLRHKARVEVLTQAIAAVAEEYGLQVTRIDPLVITDLIQESSRNDFGARPLEYLVDERLGGIFAAAVALGCFRVSVIGPPYRCIEANNQLFRQEAEKLRVDG